MLTRLRLFRASRTMLAALFLSTVSLLAFSSTPSLAQQPTWVKIKQFPFPVGYYVSSMWATNPQTILIGWHWNNAASDMGMVMRSTDGGVSWNNCTIPALGGNVTPTVSDIWFLTPDSGWLTIDGDNNPGDPWLWRTVDSGKTWTATWNGMTTPFNFGGGTSGLAAVWQTDSTLVVTENLGVGVWYSKDTGRTWLSHATLHQNGLAFDYLDGVSSEFETPSSGTNFLLTTDGGVSWTNSTALPHECWNVHCIPNTGTFVAAPEDQTILGISQRSHVLRSTTYGHFWTDVIAGGLPINTTGDVEGVEGVLFVQNSGGIVGSTPGLMESTDAGLTWVSIGGPNQGGAGPERQFDTRFVVTGCGNAVFASDDSAALWKTVDAPGLVLVDSDLASPISANICDTAFQISFLHNHNTSSITIQDIRILDSNRRPAKTGAVWLDSLPNRYATILVGDSVGFKMGWHPGAMMDSTATDSTIVRVIFHASYLVACVTAPQLAYDTVLLHVKLHGFSSPAEYALSVNAIKTDTLLTCMSLDTTIEVINQGCDSLAITKALLAKNAWTLSDVLGKPLKLPIRLGPGDTLRLQLRGTPTNKAVLYDSLQVTMRYQGHDTLWGAALRTYVKLDTANPALTTLPAVAFDSVATCDSIPQLFRITNTGCDTLSLSKFDLADSHFELLDTNGKPLALPLKIPADSSRPVMIRFIPRTLGEQSTTLRLHYHRAIYSAFDSSNVTTITGTGAASGTVAYAKSLDFGNVSVCGLSDTTITFVNNTCDSAYVDSLLLPAPFLLLDSAKVPEWVPSGGTLTLRIRYRPQAKKLEAGAAYVKVVFKNNTQPSITDTIRFSGTGISGISAFGTNPQISASTFAFGTLSECDHADSVTFTVFNAGCDTLRVTNLTLDPSLTGTFEDFTDKPLPALLAVGDSLHVTLAITSLVANTYTGNFHLHYTLADGSTHDSIMPVSLLVTTGGGSSALNMTSPVTFDFKTVHACTSPDTTISITNTGCGTDTVFFSLAGTGFTLGTGSDTIRITPGETVRVPIFYDGSSRGNLNATLALRTNVKNNNLSNVQLLGNVPPVDTVHFKIVFSKMPVASGESFTASLVPDIKISGIGLHEIHGVFEYRSNSFEVFQGTMTSPLSLGQSGPKRVGGIEMYSFDVTSSSDIPLDPAIPIVSLPMTAMISDSVGGRIEVDSLALNPADPTFSTCQLASNGLGLDASLAIRCGDSTLIYDLDGKPVVTAARLRPNPVTSENGYRTTLDLTSAVDGAAQIILYDGVGREVSRDALLLTHGVQQPYTFDLRNLPTGSYYYELRFAGANTSGSAKDMLLLVK